MHEGVAHIGISGVTRTEASSTAVPTIKGTSFRRLPVSVFGSEYRTVKNSCLPKPSAKRQSPDYTGLFKMIVAVLTTCHTQYT